MPLIEAALAFAITMLALSLVVSSFVEIIHRIFSMREHGLRHMLGRLFDQVLRKYLKREDLEKLVDKSKIPDAAKADISVLVDNVRAAFVARMSANRAPMGVDPKATPADPAERVAHNRTCFVGLWNGRDLAAMTSTEFMERLGSIDVGQKIREAATDGGKAAAEAIDAVLKDIAQKFEAFGKDASDYFEGRARLLSVTVAIVLAFLAHVDAVDLFKTYLRDPNARAKVVEQSAAVTAQHKAAADAAKALAEVSNAAPDTKEDIRKQVDALQDDLKTAIAGAKATVKQYADLGAPIGWTDDRLDAVHPANLVWICSDGDRSEAKKAWQMECKKTGNTFVFFTRPRVILDWVYLILGGLLIGLGAPFWYNAVNGLINLGNTARGATARCAIAHGSAGARGSRGRHRQ